MDLRLESGTTSGDLAAASERIRSHYGCARADVLPNARYGHRVQLVLRWTSQPELLRYVRAFPPSSSLVPTSSTAALPLGVDLDGEPVSVGLFHPTVGGSSLLIGGVPGTGKTTALRVVLAGLAQTSAAIVVIDPTGGAEASLWAPRLGGAVLDADSAPTSELLQQVLSIIERRGRLLAAGVALGHLLPIVLVCDELAELGAAGSSKQQDEVRTLLRRITALGRKANVACVFATQRTTANSIDVTTRSLVAWRLALAHPGDRYGSEALLGPSRFAASELPKAARGLGYLTDGGEPRLLQVFDLAASEVPLYLFPGLCRSLDEVASWDEALGRELRS